MVFFPVSLAWAHSFYRVIDVFKIWEWEKRKKFLTKLQPNTCDDILRSEAGASQGNECSESFVLQKILPFPPLPEQRCNKENHTMSQGSRGGIERAVLENESLSYIFIHYVKEYIDHSSVGEKPGLVLKFWAHFPCRRERTKNIRKRSAPFP